MVLPFLSLTCHASYTCNITLCQACTDVMPPHLYARVAALLLPGMRCTPSALGVSKHVSVLKAPVSAPYLHFKWCTRAVHRAPAHAHRPSPPQTMHQFVICCHSPSRASFHSVTAPLPSDTDSTLPVSDQLTRHTGACARHRLSVRAVAWCRSEGQHQAGAVLFCCSGPCSVTMPIKCLRPLSAQHQCCRSERQHQAAAVRDRAA